MTDQVSQGYTPPPALTVLESRAWLIGLGGAAACALGAWLDLEQFLRSYLVAWLLCVGVALGCLAVLMLQHLTGGAWGLMIRRPLEAAARTLPFLGLLFAPVLLRLGDLYIWARPEIVAADELLAHKAPFLNQPFFIARTIAYFAIWTFLAYGLSALSRRQDATGDPALFRKMQILSGPGLGIYALTATLASVDWIMSLEPHWYSSLFGVYFVGGQAVAAFAFIIPVAVWLANREPMQGVLRPTHFHDFGKLLLAFVMLWAYFAVSQLLIIWSGNLAEEVGWYIVRADGGWKFLSIALALFHFLLPFLLLLSRNLKRSARLLTRVAILLLMMRWFDLFWQVGPIFHQGGLSFHWLDAATVVGLGGLWFAWFVRSLRSRALAPHKDPFFEEALQSG